MKTLVLIFILPVAAQAQFAPTDTIDIYGGPGTLEGRFETAAGLPDSQGWIGVDETVPEVEDRWRISTWQAANLDTTVAGNQAWWCGQEFPSCVDSLDPEGGYGNAWTTLLGTNLTIDPTRGAEVRLIGVMNIETEPGYDFVHLESAMAGQMVRASSYDGTWKRLEINVIWDWEPGDYVGEYRDEVQVQIRFQSDGGWSDEDCQWPTVAGALQADNLQVIIAQPGLPILYGPVETCEPGDPSHWRMLPPPGAGNFAQLWTGLDDVDPDRDNHSPQWAFLDDGLVVPGVGPTYCWTKCYGPDSLVVNYDSRVPFAFANSIMSPPIALPDGWEGTLRLGFDAYLDPAVCFPVGVTWGMRTTDDPTGQEGWEETWDDRIFYGDGVYRRIEYGIPDDMVPATSRFVRIKIQARQFGTLCWGPMDSPSPYLDNVRLQLGPKVVADVPEPLSFTVRAAPNPFNPATTIHWSLPAAGDLTVKIYDTRGRLVTTLHEGRAAAGPGELTWRGRDDTGGMAGAGMYFCRLESAAGVRTLKLTLLK